MKHYFHYHNLWKTPNLRHYTMTSPKMIGSVILASFNTMLK